MTNLGRLESVDLRKAWKSEPGDFTPWLAQKENIRLLGEAIRMELEVEGQEKQVGPFRADILCRNTASPHEEWVLIENQLERTDHLHLGQLITYAAGLEAVTIVWVAARFTDEHRAALDWLNSITNEEFRFFALEIELWRIGDSPPAPKFNVVCEPNDWSKSVRIVAKEGMTPGQQLRLEFWGMFVEFLEQKGYQWTRIPQPQPVYCLMFGVGRGQFTIQTVASTWDWQQEAWGAEMRVELCVTGPSSKQYFAQLCTKRDIIERGLRETVEFLEYDNSQTCRIAVRKSFDWQDKAGWSNCAEWLYEHLDSFQRVFRPIVAELDLPTPDVGDDSNTGP